MAKGRLDAGPFNKVHKGVQIKQTRHPIFQPTKGSPSTLRTQELLFPERRVGVDHQAAPRLVALMTGLCVPGPSGGQELGLPGLGSSVCRGRDGETCPRDTHH